MGTAGVNRRSSSRKIALAEAEVEVEAKTSAEHPMPYRSTITTGTLLTGAGSPVNRFSYLLEMHSPGKPAPLQLFGKRSAAKKTDG